MSFEIRLFGMLVLYQDGHRLPSFETQKARDVFGFLVLHRTRAFDRLVLASLLWGEYDEAKARKHLRLSLWRIRKLLGSLKTNGTDHSKCLEVDDGRVRFRTEPGTWLDVAEFERRLERVHLFGEKPLSAGARQQLREAVDLYRGDLIEGCYEDWCLVIRDRLRNRFLQALGALMVDYQRTHEWEEAIRCGQRLLEHDPMMESAHYHMMLSYQATGNRTRALQQFETCKEQLGEGLGVEPMDTTVALANEIQRNASGTALRSPRSPRPSQLHPSAARPSAAKPPTFDGGAKSNGDKTDEEASRPMIHQVLTELQTLGSMLQHASGRLEEAMVQIARLSREEGRNGKS